MLDQASEVIYKITDVVADGLFKAIVDKQHDLNSCDEAVTKLLKTGVRQAKDRRYDDAIASFTEASKLDPKNVSAKLRLMKVYRYKGKDLTALVLGGAALNLATEPKARSQIYCYIADICKDIFRDTESALHIEEAIEFYNQAIDASPDNILPLWNRTEAYLLRRLCESDPDIILDAETRAQQSVDAVLRMGYESKGNAKIYWGELIQDAEKSEDHPWWPNDETWQLKLKKLKEIAGRIDFSDMNDDSIASERVPGLTKNRSLIKGLIAASIMLALIGVQALTSSAEGGQFKLSVPPSVMTQIPSSGMTQSGGSNENYRILTIFPESEVGRELVINKLESIEPRWDDLVAVEPKWVDLA